MDQNSNLTPKKPSKSPTLRFEIIHQRMYEKMEDIQTYQTRKEERRKSLTKNWTICKNALSQSKFLPVSRRRSKSCVAIRIQNETSNTKLQLTPLVKTRIQPKTPSKSKFVTPLKNARKSLRKSQSTVAVLSLYKNRLANGTPKIIRTDKLNSRQTIPRVKTIDQSRTPSQKEFVTPLKGSSQRKSSNLTNETPKKRVANRTPKTRRDAQQWTLPQLFPQTETRAQPSPSRPRWKY